MASVSEFYRDFNALLSLARAGKSVTRLADLESAYLTALLSWRVAVESCRLKIGRGVHADNRRMDTDARAALHTANEVLKNGVPAKEIVELISNAGFFVEGFKTN